MLTQTATVHPAAEVTAYGAAVAGASYDLPTRVRYRRTELATQAGEAAVADGFLWLDTDAVVPGIKAKLTLPNGDLTAVIAIEPVNDEVALHHTKVYFGTPANG
jgi:hypothetical protein